MSRIEGCFQRLRGEGRKALIPYITAGDPRPEVTVPLLHGLVAAGADLVEVGVPFSDPMADGPVIQRACERALAHHVTLTEVLAMVKAFRAEDGMTPVVLMGYLNPIEAMGYQAFVRAAAEAGVDGVLAVDLPPEEADSLLPLLDAAGVDPIFLVAPTTSAARLARISERARGFVYYISLKGVTGAQSLDTDTVAAKVAELRAVTELPINVGFGIRDGASAARVAAAADGVIVGSALVQRIAETANDDPVAAATALVAEMRRAMDAESLRPAGGQSS